MPMALSKEELVFLGLRDLQELLIKSHLIKREGSPIYTYIGYHSGLLMKKILRILKIVWPTCAQLNLRTISGDSCYIVD